MSECDFCGRTHDADGRQYTGRQIGRVAQATGRTIGDFAEAFGIARTRLALLYVKLNTAAGQDVELCSACAERVDRCLAGAKTWWQFWK